MQMCRSRSSRALVSQLLEYEIGGRRDSPPVYDITACACVVTLPPLVVLGYRVQLWWPQAWALFNPFDADFQRLWRALTLRL